MKPFIQPRWWPVVGWAVWLLVGLLCAYVYATRPTAFWASRAASAAPVAEQDSVVQALQSLAVLKASGWMQGRTDSQPPGPATDLIAPAPEPAVQSEAKASPASPVDPSLQGAVVVRSGKQLYLVLGFKRFRVGDPIGTGESIRQLTLQTVELTTPEGRARTVEIGRRIGPAAEQATW